MLLQTDDKIVHLKDATERNGQLTEPYPIGFSTFDEVMRGGVRAGDLIIITGLSAAGKTTLAQNITVALSHNQMPCLWFTYEGLPDNLYAKFKEMGGEEEYLIYVPLKLKSGRIDWIKNKISEGQKEFMTHFVFIDHIDFLTPIKLTSDQRRIILRDICQELKQLALDLEVVIFLMAHVKKVQGREIEMQDIAESSGIYQLADYVFAVNKLTIKQNIKGRIVEIDKMEAMIKMLKNRMTGRNPFAFYSLVNNMYVPLNSQ